jgi:hypothetical protein
MPQYHLHILCDGAMIEDEEGSEFADLNSAVREAIRSVRSLVSGDVLGGRLHLDLSIEICSIERQPLRTVSFEDAITTRGARSIG